MSITVDLLITNGKIATVSGGSGPKIDKEMNEVGWIENGMIAIADGKICFVGDQSELDRISIEAIHIYNADGRLITPGLIDPHTHLIHGGSREHELSMKLRGMSYLDILAQ